MERPWIVTIDGPVGAGKSTVARLLARRMGWLYLDTGAMYRAVGWKVWEAGLDPEQQEADVVRLCRNLHLEMDWEGGACRIRVDGQDVTQKIRSPEIGQMASRISTIPGIREHLVRLQRGIGYREARRRGGVVVEGRDMGTVVFPEAPAKFYLDADLETRARRRWEELRQRGASLSLEETRQTVLERDRRDMERPVAPLRRAPDAHLLDTTGLEPEAVVEQMLAILQQHRAPAS